MERPSKRPRLSVGTPDVPEDFDLQEARARNDLRLKSLFESIFEKYGRDFSDVGDEIDLRTGEIVVNKGHILGMQSEDDIGEGAEQLVHEQLKSFSQSRDPSPRPATGGKLDRLQDVGQEKYVNGMNATDTKVTTGKAMLESLIARPVEEDFDVDGQSDADDDRSSVDSLLGDAVPISDHPSQSVHEQPKAMLRSSSLHYPEESTKDSHPKGQPLDPLWQVPDIDAKFSTPNTNKKPLKPELAISQVRSASPPTAGSLWALPTPGRRRHTDVKKNRRSPGVRAKRKRKLPIVRDWSFAQLRDESDSDDPLQEDFPSPSKSASSVRTMSVTPTPTKGKADRTRGLQARKQKVDVDSLDDVRRSGIRSSSGSKNTPELSESSSLAQDSTSIVKMGKLDQDSTSANENETGLLTPDQAELHSRSQEEIEHQFLRRQAGNKTGKTGTRESLQHPNDPGPGSKDGRVLAHSVAAERSLASQADFSTPHRLNGNTATSKQSENLLGEDADHVHTKSGISSIEIEARPYGSIAGTRKTSLAKASMNPLAKCPSKKL
ncbi:hypothetical protein VTN77DRAFT_3475 [Rasamsonia byssochlamydoides]|uniref:uncharacterized protein n=1 Tax=Rasamsonia byssochlamydoides TaxID=89139 RepID=UPI003744A9CE